jgi:hypothetical protein
VPGNVEVIVRQIGGDLVQPVDVQVDRTNDGFLGVTVVRDCVF